MTEFVSESVPLPLSVESLIEEMCVQKLLPLPNFSARKILFNIGEVAAIDVLRKIGITRTPIRDLSSYIIFMANKYYKSSSSSSFPIPDAESICISSPSASSTASTPNRNPFYDSPTSKQFLESPFSAETPIQRQNSSLSCSSLKEAIPNYSPSTSQSVSSHIKLVTSASPGSSGTKPKNVDQHFSGSPSSSHGGSPVQKKLFTSSYSPTPKYPINPKALDLSELEFRKLFMVYSYFGRKKVEDTVSDNDAIKIMSMKNIPMLKFEDWMWKNFGCHYCQPCDRAVYHDWDSGKTHLYFCYVYSDGSYQFKGPYLATQRTHLQKALGDENVLIVKFAEAETDTMTARYYKMIAEAGILVGLTRYRFFVFKDGGKESLKNGNVDKKRRSSGTVKCYFVKRESIAPWIERDNSLMSYKTTHDLRCLFMHVHTVPSMAKYIARFSLILSTTIKLPIDLASVSVEEIDDIPCIDQYGSIVYDEDDNPLIQTDGTGFISEDLAVLVPNNFYDAKYMKDKDYKKLELHQPEVGSTPLRDAPLLIQCRLFNEGSAVKGTLLVNKKLGPRTIQVRPSMIKVKKDRTLSQTKTFNSLEVVAISHKPNEAKLSKHLIALLSIGGVPKKYFLDLLERTLEEVQSVFIDRRAAFRVANIYQQIDDSGICLEMFGACIPLSESFFQYRLSQLAKEERKGLGEGKIPLSDSFYLMGTTDPTGTLNRDEVCIILGNGQLSGKVLVYRNPGLHFGDIHVLNARHVAELRDYVGNGKYAIFFSTKGRRSVANEIANGDFDGDLYWVTNNHELLDNFKACEPWTRSSSTPSTSDKKPSDFSPEELEHELIRLFFSPNSHSAAGTAADSWMAFMDQYLTLLDNDADEKHVLKRKMLTLIDLYYDALDAPKSGQKVVIPHGLKATHYPHYMCRKPDYHSTSILGQIYDRFQSCKNEKLQAQEISKLNDFNVNIPDSCLKLWKENYQAYRIDMSSALRYNDISKNEAANSVIEKYKLMLYGASDLKDSTRNMDDVYDEALAIYHVCYDYAIRWKDVGKCGFAWKVAGSALCAYYRKIHCMKTGDREITFISSAFDGIF
uniref:probable RNA-dependent RNA polymerase 5 isoform X2 n=1 Tax=Erigeron canadensis TaxID=72917 RepID=UPI001CB941CD|nr:probable RNA-dependent RNA polymerase 5 isoform X2 [Erigeron canadensis]